MEKVQEPIPTRYGVAYAVMREMRWSWTDLCATPNDLIEEIAERIQANSHWEHEASKRDKAKSKGGKR